MKGVLYDDGKITGKIWGGPYYDRPLNMLGVKMAAEIDLSCDIDIPTEDFNVPTMAAMQSGVAQALVFLGLGRELYAGCMGGVGRTGLFMAVMLKVAHERKWGTGWRKYIRRWFEPRLDYVSQVRLDYHSHAVETAKQELFLLNFEVAI